MIAAVAVETVVTVDDRLTSLESDMKHVKSDISEMKGDIRFGRTDTQGLRNEFHEFRADVAREFGKVHATMASEFGALRTQIAQTKVWMLTTGIATVLSVAAIVGFKTH